MPNFGALAQELGTQRGDYADVMLRLRYAREGRLIGSSAKDERKPQIAEVHAISGLFCCLAGGPQRGVVSAVRALWRLKPTFLRPVEQDELGNEITRPALPFEEGFTFGQAVCGEMTSFMSNSLAALQERRETIGEASKLRISVWEGCSQAAIVKSGWIQFFGHPVSQTSSFIETVTTAPGASIERLAWLVDESRQEAMRRRVEIPTDESWTALGFVKPELHILAHSLVELPAEAPESAAPGMKETAALAGATALSDNDEPATRRAAPTHREQPNRTHTRGAMPKSQVGPPQPPSAGVRHVGDDPYNGPLFPFDCADAA